MTNRGPAAPPRTALLLAAGVVMFEAASAAAVRPIVPALLTTMSGADRGQMALVYGGFIATFGVAQIFAAPVLGALSDRFGRRPVILWALLGQSISYLLAACTHDLGALFAARFLSGAFAGAISVAYAYVTDATAPQHRARAFGQLAAVIGVGAILGPAIGGLIGEIHLRAPFVVAAGLSLLAAGYGLWALPESLAPDQRRPLSWSGLHPIGAAAGLIRAYPRLRGWALAYLLLTFAALGAGSAMPLYTTLRFDWSPGVLGAFSASLALTAIAVQAGVVSMAIRRLGEHRAIQLGLALQVLMMALAPLAPNTGSLWATQILLVSGSFAGPIGAAMVSRLVQAGDQGRLQAATRSIDSGLNIIAPLLFGFLIGQAAKSGHDGFLSWPLGLAAALAALGALAANAAVKAVAPDTPAASNGGAVG